MMQNIKRFTVVPSIPEPIAPLLELAYNLWWTWNYEAVTLFQRLDRRLWDQARHNPVKLLADVPQQRLEEVANDPAYLAHMDRVLDQLGEYMEADTWFEKKYPDLKERLIAYFSMEFGLHECLPMYSGGLGCLAGDHLKSASDLGVPLVGIGLLYHQGYFQQFLSNDGWQFEDYPQLDIHHMPMKRVDDADGKPLLVRFPVGSREVAAQVYIVQVARTKLYLLDTAIPENHPDDRNITVRLYGGDQDMRIRQEIVLGFGGTKALRALGHDPDLFHMNEGHSAFLVLERIAHLVETEKLSFAEAREAVAGSTIFTTHTPVPAGIDTFPHSLVYNYLSPYAKRMKCTVEELISLGQTYSHNPDEPFSMATLALRLTRKSNGVSKIHGRIAREMWRSNWPSVPVEEVPITSVTNGIHVRSWVSSDISQLFERYLGPEWVANPDDSEIWNRVDDIPDAELWRAHERRRERLVVETRRHLKEQFIKRGAPPSQIAEADELLNPEALTIGFARRFAPYKRATLLLRDEERLLKLLTNTDRPVQIVFAGKAHPRDNMGKELIKRIVQFARRSEIRNRIAFVENYHIGIARFLVQGVDVWLNTPTKPLEASGTSGMKVTSNGGLNFSILDGWWAEGYKGTNGWMIGDDRIYDNQDYQDFVESESIYDTLEGEIIPMFYDRGSDGLPRKWIATMKASMRTLTARFSSFRMVREYADKLYIPTMRNGIHLRAEGFNAARSLAKWRRGISQRWAGVEIKDFNTSAAREQKVGSTIAVTARVKLGEVSPDDVVVQLYHGPTPTNGMIEAGRASAMECQQRSADGVFEYTGIIPCSTSGQHAFTVRVLPRHPDISGEHDFSLIKWA